ncbi:ATP-binding protein [Actinotalea ferrariae]|uniref:ATP-binding protein n=1 Tax=Actinotalea ferrariae TaxID=1386098 RepID=UPI001C8B9F2A|nr:ATP-binding protein [Actinotalea ferrariae]MBX9243886.1 ATP-binding protein [Actinotalea ferrariae]
MDVVELRVPADVRNIRRARQWVRTQALTRGVTAQPLRVVELLASELVTNAVKYGRGTEVLVRLGVVADGLRVEVHDDNPTLPQVLDPSREQAGGRGMRLVSMLAGTWGVDPHPGDGKSVWFAVPVEEDGAVAVAG